jgi:rSAM/selenodomain-associated transferase 2
MERLSIILPVLNEGERIAPALARLQPLRARGVEVIVVDGGSRDATAARAEALADLVVASPRGRAMQMNAGAAASSGDVLLFSHADTQLPANADALIRAELQQKTCVWGRFDVQIEGRSKLLPLVASAMNVRSRLSGIATGDQAIFITREAFVAVGRFPDIALMEDIAISRKLKRLSRPACIRTPVVTSGRRWDEHGALRTIMLMWSLRLAYFLGTHPNRLARRYGYVPR